MLKDFEVQRDRNVNSFKEKKSALDERRFQDIEDQRYQEGLEHLHTELNTPKYNAEALHENALKEKKQLDQEKDTIFKKWE